MLSSSREFLQLHVLKMCSGRCHKDSNPVCLQMLLWTGKESASKKRGEREGGACSVGSDTLVPPQIMPVR